MRQRLRSGAPFVVAHHSVPSGEARVVWLARYAAFAVASGVPADDAAEARVAIAERLPILTPDEDEAIMHDAGFIDVAMFYTGFTFRGWVAYAP